MCRGHVQPRKQRLRLGGTDRLVGREMVEVGDDEREPGAARRATCTRSAERVAPRSRRSARSPQRLPHQQRVAVLRAPGPAAVRLVPALAGRAEQAVLLQRVHDLLEPDEVGLERGHVREEQGHALVPAVGEVADVEGGDMQGVHGGLVRQAEAPGDGRPAMGMVTVKVEPAPSTDSTPIRPPCPSTTWRAIARPRPVPPPRTRARSAL